VPPGPALAKAGNAVSEVDLNELDALSRDELIARAAALGVTRPELLTRVELRDEMVRISETDEAKRQRARGWFGVARDLVASVVEQRLNLPDAADLIRGVNVRLPNNVQPVATVTLAEIYAAQGHVKRAIKMLDEVLQGEPEHQAAHELRDRLTTQPEPEIAAQPSEAPPDAEEYEDVLTAPEPEASVIPLAAEVGQAEPTALEPVEGVSAEPQAQAAAQAEPAALEPVEAVALEPQAPPAAPPAVAEAEPTALEPIEAVAPESQNVATTGSDVREPSEPEPLEDELTLVVYRRSGTSVICHWSIAEPVWEEWSSPGEGQWVVRAVQVVPAVPSTEPLQHDIPLPGTSGEVMLNDVPSNQQVRMALGWLSGERFVPVAIGVEVTGSRAEDLSLAWVPLSVPFEPPFELYLDCARKSWRYLEMGSGT